MKNDIVLGSITFSSKSKAMDYVRQILRNHRVGDYLFGEEAAVVLDTLQRHPGCAEKVGLGVRRVGIFANGEARSGQGFGIERVDGTTSRFSYKICFSAERRSHVNRVNEALRQAVRPSILKWKDCTFRKNNNYMRCPEMGTTIDPKCCHVDHEFPPFAKAVEDFLLIENLTYENIAVDISDGEQVEAVLSDLELRSRWIRFHNKIVKLRIISVEGHRRLHENP